MTISIEKESIWWREPMVWLIFTLPLLAVVAGLTTVWIAYKNADTVLDDKDSKGVAVTQANEMDKRAQYLSLSADLDLAKTGTLSIVLNGKLRARPHHLLLKLARTYGGDSGSDITLLALPNQAGTYTTVLPTISDGEHKFILEPEDREWRLTGSWDGSLSRALHLAAKSASDSSMLP
jgi:hypothetical protein